ncbi:hypothetical protein RJT34_10099 [Clitoria ternatea]|uniref:Uncharacterized protein n=1 Tax=Clitoria ternatea TaxID=43366 RepID=A0AAN9PVH3_CLITE
MAPHNSNSIEVGSAWSACTNKNNNDNDFRSGVEELPTSSAKCECCGMCEEFTQEYIKRVRETFLGRLICGLCGEAVNVEMEKNGGKREKGLEEHMSVCVKFNSLGRSCSWLYLAEDVKEILKKASRTNPPHPTR